MTTLLSPSDTRVPLTLSARLAQVEIHLSPSPSPTPSPTLSRAPLGALSSRLEDQRRRRVERDIALVARRAVLAAPGATWC